MNGHDLMICHGYTLLPLLQHDATRVRKVERERDKIPSKYSKSFSLGKLSHPVHDIQSYSISSESIQ